MEQRTCAAQRTATYLFALQFTRYMFFPVLTNLEINLYAGVVHGFAVRGDLSDKRAKYAKEAAFLQAVQWFDFHLKGEDLAVA